MADKEPFSSLTGIEQAVQIAFGRRGENSDGVYESANGFV
jgi:hypothetical protein